jgi:hypothetical protein
LAIDHSHDECPTPHHQCKERNCLVPSWHPCSGDHCPVSFQDYSYDMRCAEADADADIDKLQYE